MKIYTSADQLIGKTPLLELTHLEKSLDLKAKLLAKLEYLNPAGSVKDRVGKAMLDDAEKRGLLTRSEDPADRRTVHLRLTDASWEIVQKGQTAQKMFFSYIHQGVSQEQIDLMMDFARRVSENIRNIEEVI